MCMANPSGELAATFEATFLEAIVLKLCLARAATTEAILRPRAVATFKQYLGHGHAGFGENLARVALYRRRRTVCAMA